MIIGVSNGNERTFTRRAACGRAFVGVETPPRASRSLRLDATAPEPQLSSPHKKSQAAQVVNAQGR